MKNNADPTDSARSTPPSSVPLRQVGNSLFRSVIGCSSMWIWIWLAVAFLIIAPHAGGQIALRHTVQVASRFSTINHPSLNNKPDRIVIVSHEFSGIGPYVVPPLSASYSGDRWIISSGDDSPLPINAKLNILAAAPGENAFIHLASAANTSSHVTTLDSPVLNNKPDARIFVTDAVINAHPIGVFYAGNRWRIFTQNSSAIREGARFHVYVDDRGFVADAPTSPIGNNFTMDHISTNEKNTAMVFQTQYWTGVYNPHSTGVWYVAPRWRIFNQDRAAMPANARFNVLALSEGDNTEYLPVTPRASEYDAASMGVEYPYESRLNPQTSITLEAWVFPNGRSSCGTIISNNFAGSTGSYWLGLCPQLRFYRSGGASVEATLPVQAFKWSHVAVTYDGTNARFFINGQAAGVRPLTNAGTGGNHPVMIGRDPAGFYFGGSLDEIRLWRGTRTQSQIQQNMWLEPRDEANLAAVFNTGGSYEVLGDLTGTPQPRKPKLSGTGILPRALRIPRAPDSAVPFVDGRVDAFLEYAGAERFVLRYPSSDQPDRVGYLIHNGSQLFGGITDLNTPLPGITPDQSFGAASFDADGSGASFAGLDDLRISHTLGTIKRLDEGNDRGGWQSARNPLGWQAVMGSTIDEFAAGSMEFSMNLNRLGSTAAEALTQTDRFAFFHHGYDVVGDHFGSPGNAQPASPVTWAPMTYTNEISGPQPSRGVFSGLVVDSTSGAGLANREVRLFSPNGLLYAVSRTNETGSFYINRVVPSIPLTVQVVLEDGERTTPPVIINNLSGPAPVFTSNTDARYPSCDFEVCEYDTIRFHIRTLIDATTVTSIPSSATAPLTVRGGAEPRVHPAGNVILEGTNIHPDLEVFFATQVTTPLTTPLAGLTEGTHFWRATVRTVTPQHLTVSCPDIPLNRRPGSFKIVIRDTWNRPANSSANAWKVAAGVIHVQNPPYPMMHGLPFANFGDGHDIDDYRAAFPDQVCDPFHMVGFWAFFPLYKLLLDDAGECYGFSLASQRFAKGLSTSLYHGDVRFANGFPLQTPAAFNVSNPCSPSPINVVGLIRASHGIQLSSESIAATLSQFDLSLRVGDPRFGITTNMQQAIATLTTHPLDYHLCIRDGDKGHCVQPLKVIHEVRDGAGVILPNMRKVEIYDPNHPNVTREINVDIVRNQYTYDGFSELWSGQWMPIYRTDPLVHGGRHVPSFDIAGSALDRLGVRGLFELLQMVVAGDAEPLITSAGGGQVGWNQTGDWVETSTETWPIPIFNWSDTITPRLGHAPVTMIHRLINGTPDVSLHARGSDYTVHTSCEGTMYQLYVKDAIDGQMDTLSFTTTGAVADGLVFKPGGTGVRTTRALIALCRNREKYPASISLGDLKVPAAKGIIIRSLPDASGIEFLNDTGLAQTPVISVLLPSSNKSTSQPVIAPAISIPADSSFRMRSEDGLDYTNLIAELDSDRDGTVDRRWLFRTNSLTLEELPIFPPDPDIPVLTLTRMTKSLQLSWLTRPGWILTSSADLSHWESVPGVVIDGVSSTHTIPIPVSGKPALFFRLEKR